MIAPADVTHRVTQLLYSEARLLDEGRFEEWLALMTTDLKYMAHIQQDTAADWTDNASPRLAYLDETAGSLQLRVLKIRTNLSQTEVPRSRTVRLISNVQVEETEAKDTYLVRSAFLLYRNHRQRDIETLAGHRTDHWRQEKDGLKLCVREIRFAANVLPTKSLSLFY